MDDRETQELTRRLKAEAVRLGFSDVGIAPAVPPGSHGAYQEWLSRGYGAGMEYLARGAEARSHPDRLLPGVRTLVMVSLVYGERIPEPSSPKEARVARYARGADYHEILWRKLEQLFDWLRSECPSVKGRAVTDSAPLLERDFARMAGLGWVAKNTMLISRKLGSFTFLGALLIDLELTPDRPHEANHCGSCTRCLDACPTQAFPEPYRLDARRCISYWTIEHRGAIPENVADQLHGWVFGCDVCQDVCPWNRKVPAGTIDALKGRSEWTNPDLIAWLARDRTSWVTLLKGTALKRTKREGLLRNAALILGTRRVREAVPALTERFLDEAEASAVRLAATWALGRIGTAEAVATLSAHRITDPEIALAIERALADAQRQNETEAEGSGLPPPRFANFTLESDDH